MEKLINLEEINLANLDMWGFLSITFIENLKHMKFFNLSYNRMEGEIPDPDTWKDWWELEIIELNNNNFSGILPTNWDHLHNLQFLNVGNNSLGNEEPMPVYMGM
jgi:hypothetical protein